MQAQNRQHMSKARERASIMRARNMMHATKLELSNTCGSSGNKAPGMANIWPGTAPCQNVRTTHPTVLHARKHHAVVCQRTGCDARRPERHALCTGTTHCTANKMRPASLVDANRTTHRISKGGAGPGPSPPGDSPDKDGVHAACDIRPYWYADICASNMQGT